MFENRELRRWVGFWSLEKNVVKHSKEKGTAVKYIVTE